MRKLILLFIIMISEARVPCKYEYQCDGCTVCVNNTCLPFDVGENCIPENYVEIKNDLDLYYGFYYLQKVEIEEYRCHEYGVSVRFTTGMESSANITKDYFNKNYKELMVKDCEGWSFIEKTY